MNILEQTHYPNKVCYDFDDEPFKIGRMSEYLKFKEKKIIFIVSIFI